MSAVAEDQLFRMPTLGADMTEGRVVEWLVQPGQQVQRGDIVAVIDTDKSDIEVEVFEPCIFEEFLVGLGETVDVGTPIARITPLEPAGATPPEPPRRRPREAAGVTEPTEETAETERRAPPAVPRPIATRPLDAQRRLTPRARRLAFELGVSPDVLPRGVVSGDGVLSVAGTDRGMPEVATGTPVAPTDRATSLRRVIADRMQRAWAEIPHYHVSDRLDVSAVVERLTTRNEGRQAADRVVMAAVLNTAIARAVADVPDVNGWWLDDAMRRSDAVDLGIVVSLRSGGIVVPVVTAADRLDVDAMMGAMRELVERARRGRLRPRDVTDASITVTNLGEGGPAEVFGVIHPPQVALVGIGGVHEEPLVVDGNIVAAHVVHITVAGDHRAHDGAAAARLLERIDHHLEGLP